MMDPVQIQAMRADTRFQFQLARLFGQQGTSVHPLLKISVIAYRWRDEVYLTNQPI